MRIKGYFYVFLIMLTVLNMKGLKFHSTHFFSELIVALGCLLVLTFKLSDFEEEQNYTRLGRIVLIGVFLGYGLYELESYLF